MYALIALLVPWLCYALYKWNFQPKTWDEKVRWNCLLIGILLTFVI